MNSFLYGPNGLFSKYSMYTRSATRNFLGQGRLCEIRTFQEIFRQKFKKKDLAGENFGDFSTRSS